jgi:hypothetical protein
VEGLEVNQRQLFNFATDHYKQLLDNERLTQFLINLDGKAGTSKSHFIMFLSTTLQNMADSYNRPIPILRVAPTGVAAHGISGRTLHALFRIPVKLTKEYDRLNPQNLQSIQASLRGISYLIIDEKSMIGLKLFFWLN